MFISNSSSFVYIYNRSISLKKYNWTQNTIEHTIFTIHKLKDNNIVSYV